MTWLERTWFGRSWGAPACQDLKHVTTPVGERCLFCDEIIGEYDSGFVTPYIHHVGAGGAQRVVTDKRALHRECDLRATLGSVGHLLHRCPCFGGTMSDPPGMSRRQAAIAAATIFEEGRGYAIEIVNEQESIVCFTCGRRSYSADDIAHLYCGECLAFHQARDLQRKFGFYDPKAEA